MRRAAFVLVVWGLLCLPGAAAAQSKARSAPNLFAFSLRTLLGNRVACGLEWDGEICADVSPVIGSGYWPSGSPNQYIFTSGLQIVGLIPTTAGFLWAGDTVGAFFMDISSYQRHGEALSLLFSSRDTADLAQWPQGAFVRDTGAFHSLYHGRHFVSDHDIWGRYWDGNPRFLIGRTHPMGVLVEQRAIAWNYPEWNRDVIYFVFQVTNITARNPAVYANPELAAFGARFQDSSEAILGVTIPDDGYTLDSVFTALTMDPDVGDAGHNYSSAVLPLGTALAYKADFLEPSFVFLPEIHEIGRAHV